MAASQSLAGIDINADAIEELVATSKKKNRNVWKDVHKMALVNHIYLDECCPIGKRSHKEVNAAWASLIRALGIRSDGLFDGFNLSIPAVRR
eukprot:jgi/Pico_ML_1/51551/g2557.t1